MTPFAGRTLLIGLLLLLPSLAFAAAETPNNDGIALPEGTLTAQELKLLFSNKTVFSVTAVGGRESISYFDPSGIIRQQRNGITRSGHWRVTDNHRICLQMEDLPEKCRIVVKEQGRYRKYIVRKNGKHQMTVAYPLFREGNPLGL